MDLQLDGAVVVVTGASKGIGLAVTDAFAREGARVVTGSRTVTDELAALRDSAQVSVVVADLATPDGPRQVAEQAIAAHGRIDVLVNNVGAGAPRAGFLDVPDDEWRRIFDISFLSAVRTTRAALPSMLDRSAAIVNISSINARLPSPMVVDYSAAKAALSNLTVSLSEEFAPHGVRVNSVSPGPVRTPFWTAPDGFSDAVAGLAGVQPATVLDDVVPGSMSISTGRVTEAAEVADLVLFLASHRAANVTGSDFVIDGGQIKTV